MKASAGQILRIDLSTTETWRETPPPSWTKRFLGGRGVNQWLLFQELSESATPFSAENILTFGTGPFAGTLVPGACRLNIDSKNAFTTGIGSSSCGGNFAPELRFAGYSHIVIRGKAPCPVYLFIADDRVEIRDAASLWGRTTWETEARIKEDLGDPHVPILSIGPAGENLVRAACIITDLEKAAGRCGLGAIMGSKNLKAIAVRGTGSIEVAAPGAFGEGIDRAWGKLQASPFLRRRGEYGIYGQVLWGENLRETSWRNFQGGTIPAPEEIARIHPDVFLTRYKKKSVSCLSCPIHCRALHEVPEGPYRGLSEGLENNDVQLFGAKLNVFDPEAILYLRSLCNQYGLDTDNLTGVIAWAYECYQRGIIDEKTTDGLRLQWGDPRTYLELIRKITYRQGFGDILAEGSRRASQIIGRGSHKYAIHMKGQDLAEQLWVHKSWALGTVLSARGGTHTRGAVLGARFQGLSPEECRKYYGVKKIGAPNEYPGKAPLVFFFERLQALCDSLGLCTFATTLWAPPPGAIDHEDMADLLSAAIGEAIHPQELMITAERIHTLEKAFNLSHTDWTRRDDYPPLRFIEEPVGICGPFQGERLHLDRWDQMLDEYYELHGWDKKTSWPYRETLEKLELPEVIHALDQMGKLPPEP